ncbi:MAG: hypothetical protein LC687_06605 [Actinobacteria bacterium]|nr:hypothetical protein [Actinomycetota bacterium]MCA1807499.1 hypothetical protein [Actinomycetota bacterium]
MANPNSPDSPTKYYFVEDATLTVYVVDNIEEGGGWVYIGTSDNPNPKMAVAAFVQSGRITQGYTIRQLL